MFTATVPVSGNGDDSSRPFSPPAVGTYRWIASYGGNANNNAVSGSCNDAGETTTVSAPAAPPGGHTPTSPNPSPSPTPSFSSSPSVAVTPDQRLDLTLTAVQALIPAGSTAQLVATGAANESYELRCYTRPSTTYVTSRSGSFDATGDAITFTLSLGRNTRCFIQYARNSPDGQSPSVVVNVMTVLSLSAARIDVRTNVFQGRNLPRVAGQLITLYRVDATGAEIGTSNVLTDASGVYRLTRRFTGHGSFDFRVRTSGSLANAAGVSKAITNPVR